MPLQQLPCPAQTRESTPSISRHQVRVERQQPLRAEAKQVDSLCDSPRWLRLRPKHGESPYVPTKRPSQSLQGLDFFGVQPPRKKKKPDIEAATPPSRLTPAKRTKSQSGPAKTKRKKVNKVPSKIRGLSRFNVSRRRQAEKSPQTPPITPSFPNGPRNAPT